MYATQINESASQSDPKTLLVISPQVIDSTYPILTIFDAQNHMSVGNGSQSRKLIFRKRFIPNAGIISHDNENVRLSSLHQDHGRRNHSDKRRNHRQTYVCNLVDAFPPRALLFFVMSNRLLL
jgi:hypothetical protein